MTSDRSQYAEGSLSRFYAKLKDILVEAEARKESMVPPPESELLRLKAYFRRVLGLDQKDVA